MTDSRFRIRSACSTAPLAWAALAAALASGCTRATGPTALGALGPGAEDLAVMRLRPDAEATSCRRWIVGIPLDGDRDADPVAPLVTRLLSGDSEATVLSEADVRWEHFSAGVYERQCVTVRGVLARPIRTITIPTDMHDHHGHEH
jgi:hypothetical protein